MAKGRSSNTAGTLVSDRSVIGPQPDGSTPVGNLPEDSVTNAQLAPMPANTVKANATALSDNPTDLAFAASRIMARLAAGNLKAATVSEVLQLLGATATGDRWPNATLAQMAANTVKANATNATDVPADLVMAASTILARLASGDVVAATVAQILVLLGASGTGNTWPNSALAPVATQTIKGRTTAGTAAPEDLTPAQAAAVIATAAVVTANATIPLAKITGGGADGSIVYAIKNGLITTWTVTNPT